MRDECLIVEFATSGDCCPLAEGSKETGAAISCLPPQLRSDGYSMLQFSVTQYADALAQFLDNDDRIRYLHISETDGRTNYRCLSKNACVVHSLMDVGLLVDGVEYRDGKERIKASVVGYDVLKGVVNTARKKDDEDISIRLDNIHLLGEIDDTPVYQQWNITPPQEKAIQVALRMGYFNTPRDSIAEEVAEQLGISKTAFLRRLHRAQQNLFQQIFDIKSGGSGIEQ